MTIPKVAITLAIPCYNEEANIEEVLNRSSASLDSLGRSWEILVIDNHSSDSTPIKAHAFARSRRRVRVVVHDRNRYYSGSCATALREATGRYVAIMDSDNQFTAVDLPKFLVKLEAGASLVFGCRKRRRDPASRKAMSIVFNYMARYYLRYPFRDLNVGLRMFDRRFVEAATIRHELNMANPELFVRAAIAGLPVAEVPIRHYERLKGNTCHHFGKLARLFMQVHRYLRDLGTELRTAPCEDERIEAERVLRAA